MTTLISPHVAHRKIRLLVSATAMVGVLGLPAAMLFGEPYPWIMMPGFESTGGYDGERVQRSTAAFVVRFADGSSTTVQPHHLFEDVPRSNHGVLTSRFSPNQRLRGRLEHLPARMLPNIRAATRSGRPDPRDTQLRTWLDEQARRLFPERQPVAVHVRWQTISIDINGLHHVVRSQHSVRFKL